MEFNERLQELRKQKGLTQEELAEALYVSRTAVSKWESGRGYPNIDSLKAISKYFSVSIDELLSGGEALAIAEDDNREKESRMRNMVFGLLDVGAAVFFFMPLFGKSVGGGAAGVTLAGYEGAGYVKMAFFAVAAAMVVCGILLLALQNCRNVFWEKNRHKISLVLNAAGTMTFIVSRQPYAAGILCVFLAVKAVMAAKWR